MKTVLPENAELLDRDTTDRIRKFPPKVLKIECGDLVNILELFLIRANLLIIEPSEGANDFWNAQKSLSKFTTLFNKLKAKVKVSNKVATQLLIQQIRFQVAVMYVEYGGYFEDYLDKLPDLSEISKLLNEVEYKL